MQPHALQHTKLPCPSPTPGVCSNSCPSSWWCHPTISSSVIPFSCCLQSFPASGSFLVSQVFTSVAKGLELQLQHQSFQWIFSVDFQRTLKSLLQHHSSKASVLQRSPFFIVQLSHPYMTTGKTIALTRRTFVGKVMSLLKGLNLIDRVPDELWTEVCDIVQETGIKTIPVEKKCKKTKMVVWGGLTNSCEKKRSEK